jgi:hypothetical protein
MCRVARLLVGVGLVVVLAAGAAVSGAASPLLGSNFRISGAAALSDEYGSAVAWSDKTEEYLVVWEDDRDYATRGQDIYGQRVGADGGRVGPNFRISGGIAITNESGPAVVWNPAAGAYLVVWSDDRDQATRGNDVFGQLVGPDGGLIGVNFRISGSDATSHEFEPAVVANEADGEYLVVWTDRRASATRGDDIYGQRLAADGSRIGGDFRISGRAATSHEMGPAVAWSQATHGYLVVWEDRRNEATRGYDIYGRRLNADGIPGGGDFRISGAAATSHETAPVVAWSQAVEEYLVVWSDYRNWATRNCDIYGQRVGGDGVRVGPNVQISGAAATSPEAFPAVAWNEAADQYLVVWQDDRNEATRGRDIYGQHLDGKGVPVGSNIRISRGPTISDQWSPAVVSNPAANEHLVVWDDQRNDATRGWDIYGQRVTG